MNQNEKIIIFYSESSHEPLLLSLPSAGNFDFRKIDADFSALSPEASKIQQSPAVFFSTLTNQQNFICMEFFPKIQLLIPVSVQTTADAFNSILSQVQRGFDGKLSILDQTIGFRERHQFHITNSTQRWPLIDKVGEFSEKLNCFSGYSQITQTVASELLTNAFYNAPRDSQGLPLTIDRNKEVVLEAGKSIFFEYGDSENYFWISVTDRFGTFNRYTLTEKLLRSKDQPLMPIEHTAGGAGIGLFMVLDLSSQIIFHFNQKAETRVSVRLLKTRRQKVFHSERVSIEIIEKNPNQ